MQPDKNQIVSIIVGVDRSTQKQIRTLAASGTVHFENGERAELDPENQLSAYFAEIFDELQRLAAPVYVELDPAKKITRVLIPLISTVLKLEELESSKDFEVVLQESHARHFLRVKNPDFNQLLQVLEESKKTTELLIVTENDENEIIDVRPASHSPLWAVPTALPAPPSDLSAEIPYISRERAKQLFDLAAAQSSQPIAEPPFSIPFLYPDDGCWARASQMCWMMLAVHASPVKVWNYGRLRVATANNPKCEVSWDWHVAPLIYCDVDGKKEPYVIDPSLFPQPVPVAQWQSVQGDPNSTLELTPASVYIRNPSDDPRGTIETDPTYGRTAWSLRYFRIKLRHRTIISGAPPYSYCK